MENELQVGSNVLLTIKKLGINGEGIAYYKRKAIFIENAIPEEVVEVDIAKILEKYCYGVVTKFKKTSPHRVNPRCQYYGKCGGCQLQHIDYKYQLIQKREILVEAFEKYYDGSKKVNILECQGMEEPYYYRNKTQLPARHNGDSVVVGMYEKDSNRLVYIDKCIIENKLIFTTMEAVLAYLSKSNIDVYNPRFRQGNLRYIIIRAFEETEEVSLTFVLIKNDLRLINILKELIKVKNVKSVNYTINQDLKAIEIINNKVINISGEQLIKGKLKDLVFEISPNSFFQLNSKQTLVLYDEILNALKPKGHEKILDLCCGIGSIGLYLSNKVSEVRGIDINYDGIENAREFAKRNDIKNAKFYCGNIVKNLIEFEHEGFVCDAVIIDPPRKGIELQLLNYFQKSKIKKIIYVSCNPATLAKNLNHLQGYYRITHVKPIDMFPQTSNVECVVCLEKI